MVNETDLLSLQHKCFVLECLCAVTCWKGGQAEPFTASALWVDMLWWLLPSSVFSNFYARACDGLTDTRKLLGPLTVALWW